MVFRGSKAPDSLVPLPGGEDEVRGADADVRGAEAEGHDADADVRGAEAEGHGAEADVRGERGASRV